MVLKLTLEYDGSNYSGWQLQPRHDSIQGRIEAALERIFAAPVRVFGSGRTDAGVHARGQVASISIPRPFDADELQRALNAMLPPDIVVLDISPAPDDFDPRRAARSRVYEYRVLNRKIASAFEYRYSWLVRDQLDLAAMNCAARSFHRRARFRGVSLSRHQRNDHRPPRDLERMDARRRPCSLPRRGIELSAAHGARDGRGDDRCGTRQADAGENRDDSRRRRSARGSGQRTARRFVPRRSPLLTARSCGSREAAASKTVGAECAPRTACAKTITIPRKKSNFSPLPLEIYALLVHPH